MTRFSGNFTLLACLLLGGCTATLGVGAGDEEGSSGSEGSGSGSEGAGDPGSLPGGGIGNGKTGEEWEPKAFDPAVVVSPISRLTQAQYAASVGQAFGVEVMLPQLPTDENAGLHRDPLSPALGEYDVYVNAAIEVGTQLAPFLTSSCDFQADATACTNSTIAPALQHLYRSPITPADVDAIATTISEATTRVGDAEHGVAHGLARALLEPRFLYRFEHGVGTPDDSGGLAVSPYEFASRLSFFAWAFPPDAELFSLADAGSLSQPEIALSQSERAIAAPSTRETVWQFVRSWLGLGDDKTEEDPLKRSMLKETRRFVEYVLVDEQAPFSDLLNANYSFIDATLAAHYGVPAPTTDWERYEFPEAAKRRGVLTHASFLSSNSAHKRDVSWIFRGKIVLEHMFCGEMNPPPAGAAEAEVEDRATTPPCSGCHSVVDPMGMFFDQFDEVGVLLSDAPAPGTVGLGSDIDRDYDDVTDFVEALSESRAFEHCFVKLWFHYALGREVAEVDQPSFDTALETLRTSGSVNRMLESIATSPSFSTYYPKPSEQICE